SRPVAVALSPFARLFRPVAVAFAPFAVLFAPVAVALSPFAVLPKPVAVAALAAVAFAVLDPPGAGASVPIALASFPVAVAARPVALAPSPTAVEKVPVAVESQVPFRALAATKQFATAGAVPNTVTIPAAIAKPRKAPPASALALIRRPRWLPTVSIALHTTAT